MEDVYGHASLSSLDPGQTFRHPLVELLASPSRFVPPLTTTSDPLFVPERKSWLVHR